MDKTENRFYREAKEANDGPAFPVPAENWSCGMTLRDYFAAKAMVALINNDFCARGINEVVATGGAARDDLIAAVAYTQADAMLRARGEV